MSAAAEKAYEYIYQSIRQGLIRPGARLIERQLCHELAVSRTPIREALRRLTAEGLVENRPHRGVIVSQLSDAELAEIFEVGVVLETTVAGVAARNSGRAAQLVLRRLLADMRAVLDQDRVAPTQYVSLDHAFHLAIAESTGNRRLVAMLRSTCDLRVLSTAFSHYNQSHFERSLRQHETIVEAIEAGDEDWAASSMRAHVLSGRATRSIHV